MKTRFLHKAGISPGILRRQICAELVDLLGVAIEGVVTRGKAWNGNRSYPRMTAYRQALYRLRRDGLIARRDILQGIGFRARRQSALVTRRIRGGSR